MLGIGTKQRCGFHLVKGIPTPHMYMYLVHVPNNNKSEQIYLNSDHDQASRDMTTK